MGVTVRQKVKGKGKPWWVFVSHDGKRTSRMVGDKAAAEQVASKIRAKLQLGEVGIFEGRKTPIPLFKHFAEDFMGTYSAMNHKETTQSSYRDVLKNHILPVFGEKPLDEITRKDVKDFLYQKHQDGLSSSTVRIIKSYLSAILNEAVDDEIIQANPAARVGKGIKKDPKENINPLSREELKTLLDSARNQFPDHYTLFLLLARTGMRVGEALGLKWDDLDFGGRFINVSRRIVKGRISTPKGGKSRAVDISRQLEEALMAHPPNGSEYVFTNGNGKFLDVDNWRKRVFNKALEKAGVRRIRIHDLRHTYATLRISKGDNIGDVANQLGHHSPKLTWDIYYHWMPGKKKSEVDALDDPEYLHPTAPYTHPTPLAHEKSLPESRLSH